MSVDELTLFATIAVAIAVLVLAWEVRQHGKAGVKALHEKPVSSPVDEQIAGHLGAIAKSVEGIHRSDRTLQERDAVAEKQEKLIQSVSEVLNAKFDPDPGLRPDLIVGQERGVTLVKDMLYTKLAEATK